MTAEELICMDPCRLKPAEYRRTMANFIAMHELNQIRCLLRKRDTELREATKGVNNTLCYSFELNATKLIAYDSSLAFSVFHHPGLLLPVFDEAVIEIQSSSLKRLEDSTHSGEEITCTPKSMTVKLKVSTRVYNLPPTFQFFRRSIGQIRSLRDATSLIQVCGTVVRTGAVRLLEKSRTYQCLNSKCGYRFKIRMDSEVGYALPMPTSCPGKILSTSKRKTHYGAEDTTSTYERCGSNNFREDYHERECIDYQEIKLQDSTERLLLGSVPRSIMIVLESDLVDIFSPGDDIVVVGQLIRQWRSVHTIQRCELNVALKVHSAYSPGARYEVKSQFNENVRMYKQYWKNHVQKKTELSGRDMLIRAVCPQLYGLHAIKLAVLLTLIGGSDPDKRSHESKQRQQNSHEHDASSTMAPKDDYQENSYEDDCMNDLFHVNE